MLDFKTSLILKIISSLFFLLSGILWKKVLMAGGRNYHFIFYRVLFTLVLFGFIYYFNQNNEPTSIAIFQLPITDWAICIGVCMLSFWGLYFYTEALQNGRLSFIAPLNGISYLFTIITSILIFNESLNTPKFLALLLVLTGLFIHQMYNFMNFKISKEVLLTLLFSIIWGISFVLYLIPIKKFGVLNFSIILELCVCFSCMGLLIFKEKILVPSSLSKNNLLICMLMGFLVAGGSLFGNFTLTQIPVSLNILIGLFFELLVLAVGLFFFREKLNSNDWMLIAFATIGGFLLLF